MSISLRAEWSRWDWGGYSLLLSKAQLIPYKNKWCNVCVVYRNIRNPTVTRVVSQWSSVLSDESSLVNEEEMLINISAYINCPNMIDWEAGQIWARNAFFGTFLDEENSKSPLTKSCWINSWNIAELSAVIPGLTGGGLIAIILNSFLKGLLRAQIVPLKGHQRYLNNYIAQ